MSAYRSLRAPEDHLFIRTHVAAYFISLLLCDMVQGIGSIINISWIQHMGVTFGPLCVAQGAIKQAGNVGTALWSFVIALHTFCLLFLGMRIKDWVCYATLVFVWLFLGFILALGPGIIASAEKGPFYGISGVWCWMTPAYPTERFTLEYLFMFASAGVSFFLYSLVFLRLRGNVTVNGWSVRFHSRDQGFKFASVTSGGAYSDPSQSKKVTTVARKMLWYPVVYTILVLPIAAARFSAFAGKTVPFAVTILSGTIFMLSGFVNTLLFTTTRRVIPASTIFPKFIRDKFGISTGVNRSTFATNSRTTNARIEKSFDIGDDGHNMRDSHILTSRSQKFDPVSPFNSQSLTSPNAYGQKRIVWGSDFDRRPSDVSLASSSTTANAPANAQLYYQPPTQYLARPSGYDRSPSPSITRGTPGGQSFDQQFRYGGAAPQKQ